MSMAAAGPILQGSPQLPSRWTMPIPTLIHTMRSKHCAVLAAIIWVNWGNVRLRLTSKAYQPAQSQESVQAMRRNGQVESTGNDEHEARKMEERA